MKKRGQLMSQPFVMIFALVVGGIILVFGAKLIFDLTKQTNQVQLSKFVNDFKEKIEEYYYLDEGSKETLTVTLPKKVKAICIKNNTVSQSLQGIPLVLQQDAISRQFIETSSKNMFFIPITKSEYSAFTIPNVVLQDGKEVECFYSKITIASKSNFVEIS